MANISELSDELLVKILSFLPTKVAVSTSVLSKQWEFLWMWLPNLQFDFSTCLNSACLRDFIVKNLPLHKAPIIESLRLCSYYGSLRPEDLKSWVEIAVSRCVRELCIDLQDMGPAASLPGSLYTCKSLVTLKLYGEMTIVDVPPTVCLPSLKILQLRDVTYSNEDTLQLLLPYCPVLKYLRIEREDYDNVMLPCSLYSWKSLVTLSLEGGRILVDVPRTVCLPSLKSLQLLRLTYPNDESLRVFLSCCPVLNFLTIDREDYDNLKVVVIIVPSLRRLTLTIDQECSSDGYVILTPSLRYLYVDDDRSESSCLIEHMPELEVADISLRADIEKDTERLLKSITNVKRLSLRITLNSGKKTVYPEGIVFCQLENLKLYISAKIGQSYLSTCSKILRTCDSLILRSRISIEVMESINRLAGVRVSAPFLNVS